MVIREVIMACPLCGAEGCHVGWGGVKGVLSLRHRRMLEDEECQAQVNIDEVASRYTQALRNTWARVEENGAKASAAVRTRNREGAMGMFGDERYAHRAVVVEPIKWVLGSPGFDADGVGMCCAKAQLEATAWRVEKKVQIPTAFVCRGCGQTSSE